MCTDLWEVDYEYSLRMYGLGPLPALNAFGDEVDESNNPVFSRNEVEWHLLVRPRSDIFNPTMDWVRDVVVIEDDRSRNPGVHLWQVEIPNIQKRNANTMITMLLTVGP
jgi:hypothetical protein